MNDAKLTTQFPSAYIKLPVLDLNSIHYHKVLVYRIAAQNNQRTYHSDFLIKVMCFFKVSYKNELK